MKSASKPTTKLRSPIHSGPMPRPVRQPLARRARRAWRLNVLRFAITRRVRQLLALRARRQGTSNVLRFAITRPVRQLRAHRKEQATSERARGATKPAVGRRPPKTNGAENENRHNPAAKNNHDENANDNKDTSAGIDLPRRRPTDIDRDPNHSQPSDIDSTSHRAIPNANAPPPTGTRTEAFSSQTHRLRTRANADAHPSEGESPARSADAHASRPRGGRVFAGTTSQSGPQ